MSLIKMTGAGAICVGDIWIIGNEETVKRKRQRGISKHKRARGKKREPGRPSRTAPC